MKDNSSHPFHHLLPGGGGWLSKVLGALLAVGIIIVSAFLAAFFFGFFLVIVALASIWLAWQRWRLRRWVRTNNQGDVPNNDDSESKVIIGEYEVVEEPEATPTRSKKQKTQTHRDEPHQP